MIKSLDDALQQQIRLKDETDYFKESTKPKESVRKEKKHWRLKMQLYFLMEDKKFLMLLKVEYFHKENQKKNLLEFWIA